MAKMTQMELEDLAGAKVAVLKEFLNAQPPIDNGEAVLAIWDKLYDSTVQSVVVDEIGPRLRRRSPQDARAGRRRLGAGRAARSGAARGCLAGGVLHKTDFQKLLFDDIKRPCMRRE